MDEQKDISSKPNTVEYNEKSITPNQWILSILVACITCFIAGMAFADFMFRTRVPNNPSSCLTKQCNNTAITVQDNIQSKETYNFRELSSYIQDQNIESFTLRLNNGKVLEIKVK